MVKIDDMKVLLVLSNCDQTGMTTHTLDLAEALLNNGVEVKLLVGYMPGNNDVSDRLFERFKATGAEITPFYLPKKRTRVDMIRGGISLVVKLLCAKANVVHIQSPYLSWAPWLLRKKFISTLHVNDLVKCFFYKNATRLIAISRETKEYAMRVFGYNESDISIVNHGVSNRFRAVLSENEIQKVRRNLGLPTDKLIILLVGSIERRKGQDILLKAVYNLPESCRNRIHVVLLGSIKSTSESTRKWLDESIESTGTRNMVSRFEYQDSALFYKISDICVLPSWLEGFGLVVIEAMLSGVLCIRTDSEGASEQISDGHTGFIFPKGDYMKLAEILENVISDDNLRRRVAAAGREYALANFTADVMARKTIDVYKQIM